jgi:hypothetical protein
MIHTVVNIESEKVRKAIAALERKMEPERCCKVIARASAQLVRDHLSGVSRARHRPGGRFNFYADAARSVHGEASPPDVRIHIPHTGMALRYKGGTVRASGQVSKVTGRPIKMLAIPIEGTKAQGHTPGDFTDLFLVKVKESKRAYLARKRGKGTIEMMFRLVPETKHKPDATVLPERREVEANAIQKLTGYLTP